MIRVVCVWQLLLLLAKVPLRGFLVVLRLDTNMALTCQQFLASGFCVGCALLGIEAFLWQLSLFRFGGFQRPLPKLVEVLWGLQLVLILDLAEFLGRRVLLWFLMKRHDDMALAFCILVYGISIRRGFVWIDGFLGPLSQVVLVGHLRKYYPWWYLLFLPINVAATSAQ